MLFEKKSKPDAIHKILSIYIKNLRATEHLF